MARRYGKQDARNAILDLNHYDADDMLADLGNHRHTDLPLSGPVNLEAPPAPNAKKFGVSAARIAAKNDDIASAWGAVYDPELDEDRDDGLGTGQAHRLGFNFRPNQNVLSGRGRGRRTRSMSPRGRFGRGRGLVEPGMLGIHMGTRPPKLPSTHRFVATAGDPSIRHVRPRVSTHAMDDMAAPSSSYHGGGGINAPPPPKPTRAPIQVDVKDVHVGHWWGGRLTVNKDVDLFFSSKRALQQAQVTEQQASSRLRKKPTISKAGFRLVQHSFGTSIHAPKKQANIPPSQNLPNTPPPCDEDWVKSPPPPPPGIVITPIERTEHRKLPLPTDSAPKAISETPDHSHQQCIPALTTLPPSPFVGHDNPPRKEPETVEEFQAKINQVDDVLGSASVLLSVYNEELDEITKEETLILRRLEAVQATKRSKQERVTKKRAFMDEKTIILKDLRERRNNLIAEMERLLVEAEEKERLARQEIQEKERLAKVELEKEKERALREQMNIEAARQQDAFIKLQIERTKQTREKLAREQKESLERKAQQEELKKEQECLEYEERLEKERLENERLERERLEREPHEKEILEQRAKNERLEHERTENQHLVLEQIEKDRLEQEQVENQRLELEQIEKDRLEQEHLLEQKRLDEGRLEQECIEQEHAEQQRLEKERMIVSPYAQAKKSLSIRPSLVFPPQERDEARDSEAFKSANPILPETAEDIKSFPYRVRIILRPIVDCDPLELAFTHTDQPGQKIRRTLMQMLGPKDTKYVMGLESCANFIDEVTHRFYGKMAAVLGGH